MEQRYIADAAYDVIVVGAGHAGCEAALAAARLGKRTLVVTIHMENIAQLPCNPSIGGPAKAHLVREIDALGGEMGKVADATLIQMRMLNTAKGPAVHSLRAQMDKQRYQQGMTTVLQNTPNLTVKQLICEAILVEDGQIKGILSQTGGMYLAPVVILATGTYLKGRIIIGDYFEDCGPNGQLSAKKLSGNLAEHGLTLQRFKTGTPARVDCRTLDYDKMSRQDGDEAGHYFSFMTTQDNNLPKQPCWLTYSNEATHEVIRENMHRSPLYGGHIDGVGARYCPSIEDKIVRFSDKSRHQIFIEPEGLGTTEMYVQGFSSSLPEEVQQMMIRTLPGLEQVEMMRPAYAIEYDCLDPQELDVSLESKIIPGLFAAGQINGSSGYEEAAAQGLIAGINAARKLDGVDPLVLKRYDGYIGVLIDDLVTKGTGEPYRMLTSRAEYRLLLRQDNADLRLTHIGRDIGLVDDMRYAAFLAKEAAIAAELTRLGELPISAKDEAISDLLLARGSDALKQGIPAATLLKRPHMTYGDLLALGYGDDALPRAVQEQVEIKIKYQGYIDKQLEQVERVRKIENRLLPQDLDYTNIAGLRLEARQKLHARKPTSLGQASRISGVSPADVAVLLVYLEQQKRQGGQG